MKEKQQITVSCINHVCGNRNNKLSIKRNTISDLKRGRKKRRKEEKCDCVCGGKSEKEIFLIISLFSKIMVQCRVCNVWWLIFLVKSCVFMCLASNCSIKYENSLSLVPYEGWFVGREIDLIVGRVFGNFPTFNT